MTPEGYVKKDIKDWIKKYSPGAWGWAPVKTVHGVNGIPDFIYCVPVRITEDMVGTDIGMFVGIEAKKTGGTQTQNQQDRERDIKNAEGFYLLIEGCDAVDRELSRLSELGHMAESTGKIKINDRFSIERDRFNWILYDAIKSKDKEGNNKLKIKRSYHPNIESICKLIIDKKLGDCKSLEEIQKLLVITIKIFHKHVENLVTKK